MVAEEAVVVVVKGGVVNAVVDSWVIVVSVVRAVVRVVGVVIDTVASWGIVFDGSVAVDTVEVGVGKVGSCQLWLDTADPAGW